jgi:hypothetical protein
VLTQQERVKDLMPAIAVGCGVIGLIVGFMMYWLVVPGVILGLAAVVLGVRARRSGSSELGSVAIALGVVGILLVPAFISVEDSGEDWGRDCALHPEHDPNC